jgi:serine/threonine-protein kinase RsbW
MKCIKLDIPSVLDNIRIIESFIDNAKDHYDLTDDIYGNIVIAVTECVNNAIVHGNHSDRSKLVHIQLLIEDHTIRIIVQDEGEGFDYNNISDPTAPENIHKLGGRGLFLMRNLCDEIEFDRNGTQIELKFYL